MTDKPDNKLTATIKATPINVIETQSTDGVDIIQLYNPVNCLRCSSLVSLSDSEEQQWYDTIGEELLYNMNCHYSLGNVLCPASKLRLAKHVDIGHVVDLYHEALNSGDIEKLNKIVKRIKSKDENTSKLIMDRIRGHNKVADTTTPIITEIDKTPTPVMDEPSIEPVIDSQPIVELVETVIEPQPIVESTDQDFMPD